MRIDGTAASVLFAILLPGAVAGQARPQPARAEIKLTEPQDDYPDVSPDGRRIVFQSNRSGSWQLWIMNNDGTGLQRLTYSGANDRTPDWSPDGSKILFSSTRPAASGQSAPEQRNIFVLDISGGVDGAEQRITRVLDHPSQDIHPKWTTDGRAIVFNRVLPGSGQDDADVMIMDSNGRNVRRIDLPRGTNTYASLTPDGTHLIYRGTTKESRDGRESVNSDIFSAAPDGSHPRRLTSEPAFDGWPAVSPDGTTIAFSSRRTGDRFHVFFMPIAGGTPRQITFGDYHYTQPAWTPDGRHIVAYRWTSDQTAEIGHIVWLNLDLTAPSARP